VCVSVLIEESQEVPANPMYHRNLADLLDRGFFDFIVGIVRYDMDGGEAPERGPVAYIWDGTDVPSNVMLQRKCLPNSANCELLPSGVPRYGSVVPLSFHASAASELRLEPLFELKTADTVPLAEASSAAATSASFAFPEEIHELKTRLQWVRLRNVVVEFDAAGSMYMKYQRKSQAFQLASTGSSVQKLLERYRHRLIHQ
jgi:hypothetical protein